MKNKLIILIGSSGFLGKNIKKEFSNKILCPSKKELNLKIFKSVFNFLNKFKKYKELKIINCACHVGNVHYGSKFPADIIYDNTIMSLNLYKACSLINKKITIINPFANCSYPKNTSIQKEQEWLDGSPHHSVLSYGSYKRFLYALSKAFYSQNNINSINWMFGGGYGPGASMNENKEHALNGMILRMIKAKKMNEKEFIVWGSGQPIREWVYIRDMAKILKRSINISNQIYPINFGQKKGYSIKQTAKIIKSELKYRGKLVFDKSKQDGDLKKVLENKTFKKMFPKFKFTSLKSGVSDTIKYYQKKLISNF